MVTIDGYEIDVTPSQDFTFDSDVTEHEVEDGSAIVDHKRLKPIVWSCDGIVSDTPIGGLATRREPGGLYSVDAYSRLLDIHERREPVTIVTGFVVLERMMLQTLSIPRTSATGDSLRFRATFKQVRVVSTDRALVRVSIPQPANTRVNRGTKPSKKITESKVPANAQPSRRTSLLSKIWGL